MKFSFPCPKCRATLQGNPEWAGKKVRCPKCSEPIQVPSPPQAAAAQGGAAGQAAVRPCPKCATPLKLGPQLHGRKIRCTGCKVVLSVAADSWDLVAAEATPAAAAASSLPPAGPADAISNDLFDEMSPLPGGLPPLGQGGLESAALQGPALSAPLAPAPKRRSKNPLLIGGAIGGGVLAIVLVVVLVILLLPGDKPAETKAAPKETTAEATFPTAPFYYLPDNCKVVGMVDMRAIVGSKFYQEGLAKNPNQQKMQADMLRMTGMGLSDVVRITIGGDPSAEAASAAAPGGAPPAASEAAPEKSPGAATGKRPQRIPRAQPSDAQFITVAELAQPVKPELMEKMRAESTEEKVEGAVIYVNRADAKMAGFFPNDRTLVAGSAKELRAALQRKREAKFSPVLDEAVRQLDRTQTVAMAMVLPEQMPQSPMPMPVPKELIGGIQSLIFHAKLVASDLQVAVSLACKDDKVAEQIQDMVKGLLAMAGMNAATMKPDAKKILDSVKIDRKGRNVSAQISVPNLDQLAASLPTAPMMPAPGAGPRIIVPPSPRQPPRQ